MLLPMFAAMPLLVAYSGGTGIAVPKPLQALLGLQGSFLELGLLYQVRVGGWLLYREEEWGGAAAGTAGKAVHGGT